MAIKLIAFDWNGTLLSDTVAAWKASDKLFLMYGLKATSITKFRQTFTIPIRDMWLANGLTKEINFQKQSEAYHPLYEKYATKSRTRSGTKQVLAWLKTSHITRMIFSNHIAPDIIKQLLRLNIFEYFDEILARPAGDHSHVKTRGKEQKLLDYVKLKKFKPHEVISVGDTEEEIEIGKKHGFYTVAITGGYNTTSRLKKHKPDFLIHNMLELKNIVKKLNKLF